jgi:hypothetical protein
VTVELRDGWLFGSLPDDTGREWPIVLHPQPSARGPLKAVAPNLVLHTTETDGYVKTLRYPSQWQCGAGIIGQHIKLGLAGDAVNDWDLHAQQIEMVGRSRLTKWLPAEPTLGPTVALVGWLHRTGRIKTGIKRPADWPVVLDRGPQAVTGYYRRNAGLWPDTPGVYGHVDIPANSHWDPGSFDYPTFFARVRNLLEGDDDVSLDEYIAGADAAWARATKTPGSVVDPGPAPAGKPPHFDAGWRSVRRNVTRLKGRDGIDGTDGVDGKDAVLAPGAALRVENV